MPQQESSVGPVIATIIILAVIVLGGLYFWSERGNNNAAPTTASSTDLNTINNQSTSDDTGSIQSDLNSTNTNIDTQINAS